MPASGWPWASAWGCCWRPTCSAGRAFPSTQGQALRSPYPCQMYLRRLGGIKCDNLLRLPRRKALNVIGNSMNITEIRQRALCSIGPLKQPDSDTQFTTFARCEASRSKSGRNLPAYYLVYFLLTDLLGFQNLGNSEKTAWSIPVDLHGKGYFIEHRKFGVGVFSTNLPDDEPACKEIVKLVRKAVRAAQPYFESRAKDAVKGIKLNVVNRCSSLFERYLFFVEMSRARKTEAMKQEAHRSIASTTVTSRFYDKKYALLQEAEWLALSGVECFFSWTEHVFVLLAILSGKGVTGEDVAKLAGENWETKFKAAVDISDPISKNYYDKLVEIRRQLRNFVAHGSFGKSGEAFEFHSGAGAVPVALPHREKGSAYMFGGGASFSEDEVLDFFDTFIKHLWSGNRESAKHYLQDSDLPVILTKVESGEYSRAMASKKGMIELRDRLQGWMDRSANMDF